jgi:hypothetical protein
MYAMKTKEAQLALIDELLDQLDLRVDFLGRQKITLKMCKQDTTRIDELLLAVCESFVKTRAYKKRLEADIAINTGSD